MFVDFNILNQLGSPSINSNTFANRPAAGQTGRLFVSTDTFELYRDNGTGWDLIGGPGSSTVTGSGAAGQVTYWTGASTIGGNNNLFWDSANFRLGIGTATPGTKLDVHTTAGAALQLNSTNAVGNIYSDYQNQGTTQYRVGYTDDADINYRRFGIYDSIGAKETITIDQQSRYVGINYQYSSLADQPQYTLDVSGSARATDSSFFVTSGTGQVGINTTSPTQATALIEAVKTDGYGLFLNYATASGSGSTATALWALNTTAGSGYAAVIEEKTANTTGGQYPLLIKHSLSSGTAAAGIGTGLHFALPDSTGTFKTTQLTVETTDAAAATYTTRYRFMAQVNGTSTALAYLTSVGLGIGNVIPSYKLDVNGTVRAFGAGNTGNYLAVDTNPGGATVQLNPQYGTGLPILQSVGSFPLLFGTNNTENMRLTTAGDLGIGTDTPIGSIEVVRNSGSSIYNTAYGSGVTSRYSTATARGTSTSPLDLLSGDRLGFFGFRGYGGGFGEVGAIICTAADNFSGTSRPTNITFQTTPVGSLSRVDRLVLRSTGNIESCVTAGNFLIGTTTDSGDKLQINGRTVGALDIVSSKNLTAQGTFQGYTGAGVFLSYESYGGRLESYSYTTSAYQNIAISPNGGNVLIGTTTDVGYKLQVNGNGLFTNSATSLLEVRATNTGGTAQILLNPANNNSYTIQTNGSTDNLTFIRNSTTLATISNAGNAEFTGSIKTGAPTGGTAAAWKLGSYKAAAVVVSTTNYIEVDIGGTLYKLAVVT